ncbi:MAG: hypothetical protein QM628_15625 [Propionicimonas sp.]
MSLLTFPAARPHADRSYLASWPDDEWVHLNRLDTHEVAAWDHTCRVDAQQAIIEARRRWGNRCPRDLLRGLAIEISLRGTPEGATMLLDLVAARPDR